MSETWLYDNDSAIISALTPESHVLHHVPRLDKKGGGVGCLINKSLQSKKRHTKCFKSFEFMEVQLSNERQKIILNIIYRPPHGNFSLFLQEIESLILESEINDVDVIYLGDFNILVDDIGNNEAQNFLRLLDNFSILNLVNEPTYNSGHTLDLVITKNHHSLVKSLTVDTINTLSDHRSVNFHLNFNYAKVERKLIRFRKKNSSFQDSLREELDEKFSLT